MIIERFQQHVKAAPDKLAIKSQKRKLTYRQLDMLSNRIANKIRTLTGEQSCIGILVDDGGETIAAILGTLKAACIYVPFSDEYPVKRMEYVMQQTAMQVFITDNKNKNLVLEAEPGQKLKLILMEEIESETRPNHLEFTREARGDIIASLLYTSGSTGRPKGVPQTHRNILYFVDRYRENLGITSADNNTVLASFTHDVTLLDMYGGLMSGATLYPLDLKKDGSFAALPQWLKKEKITIWHSVPTVFRYFTTSIETGSQLELPRLRRIVLGGESVLQADIQRYNRLFTKSHNSQLYMLYGQTESSYVSGRSIKLGETVPIITLGEINHGTRMYVVDEQGDEVEPLEVGEIIVINDHITPGYWQDERSTREKIVHDPDQGRIYYTGDMGRRLLDGAIEFMGRKDHQVKLRGNRIELEEIEQAVMQFRGITGTAVKLIEIPGQEKWIACYFQAEGDTEINLLREFLKQRLLDHMIPAYFKQLKILPTTISGKIDRQALPVPDFGHGEEYEPVQTWLESQLQEIWSDILEIGKELIGRTSNFFRLGGHSLRAVALTAEIHKRCQVKLPLAEVFERQTLKEIAAFIQQQQKTGHEPVPAAEKKEYYPLTPTQRYLYEIQRRNPGDVTYNMPTFFVFEADLGVMEEVFRRLIDHHEVLRTSFIRVKQELAQRVHEPGTLESPVEYKEIPASRATECFKDFIKPFDLTRAPLMRLGLYKMENRHMIVFDIHHIITDNISLILMEKDCSAAIERRALPGLRVQYKDYVQWQLGNFHQGKLKNQEDYWLKIFAGKVPELQLPYDNEQKDRPGSVGACELFLLGKEETRQVKVLAGETHTTFFTVALSTFIILLAGLSGQEDIVVGTPTALRDHPDQVQMSGMLINILPQRNYPTGNKTAAEFLQEVHQHALEAYENRDYPYEELVNKLSLGSKDFGGLYQVMFNLVDEQTHQDDPSKMGERDIILRHLETSRYNLSLIAIDRGSDILYRYEYRTGLFSNRQIQGFIASYKKILNSLPSRLGDRISEIAASSSN